MIARKHWEGKQPYTWVHPKCSDFSCREYGPGTGRRVECGHGPGWGGSVSMLAGCGCGVGRGIHTYLKLQTLRQTFSQTETQLVKCPRRIESWRTKDHSEREEDVYWCDSLEEIRGITHVRKASVNARVKCSVRYQEQENKALLA